MGQNQLLALLETEEVGEQAGKARRDMDIVLSAETGKKKQLSGMVTSSRFMGADHCARGASAGCKISLEKMSRH